MSRINTNTNFTEVLPEENLAGALVMNFLTFSERQGSESDEDVLVPKPATSFSNQPLYLCLRISKKHWCRHQGMFGSFPEQGEQLQDRDKKRREYWFAIPPSRYLT